jgi:hypothetical protein
LSPFVQFGHGRREAKSTVPCLLSLAPLFRILPDSAARTTYSHSLPARKRCRETGEM